jgi:hypothetical protein
MQDAFPRHQEPIGCRPMAPHNKHQLNLLFMADSHRRFDYDLTTRC